MNCNEFLQEWLQADTLSAEAKEHLEKCSSCRQKVGEYQQIMSHLEGAVYPQKVDVWARVLDKIATLGKAAKPQRKRVWITSVSVAAAISLILVMQKNVAYSSNNNLEKEDVAELLANVYGYNTDETSASHRQLEAMEYFFDYFANEGDIDENN